MCGPAILTAVGGGLTAYSQYATGASQKNYYDYMAQNATTEAGYARAEGEQALRAGELQSKLIQDTAAQQGKQLKTSQAEFNASTRANLAASGVYGVTAEDITKSNLSKEKMDELALRFNADTQSWQAITESRYKNQAKQYQAWQSNVAADQYLYQGKAAKYAGKVNAFSTLLATAAAVGTMAAGGLGGGNSGYTLKSGGSFSNTAPYTPPRF